MTPRSCSIRRRPGATLTCCALGLGLLGFSIVFNPTPKLVWNASASAPIGLYRVRRAVIQRGDLVLVRTPNAVAKFAAERGYLPMGVPLIKRVAAVAGDHVCATNGTISVNGNVVAHQLQVDNAGRSLMRWQGCETIKSGALFLLMVEAKTSFDSRYFGPVSKSCVIGKLAPLWIRCVRACGDAWTPIKDEGRE